MKRNKKAKAKKSQKYNLFEELKETLRKQEDNFWEIAEDSKVHPSTLKNWIEEKVASPQLRTLYNVAFSLGYEVKLVRMRAKLRKVA